jgi:hypothetical protein
LNIIGGQFLKLLDHPAQIAGCGIASSQVAAATRCVARKSDD